MCTWPYLVIFFIIWINFCLTNEIEVPQRNASDTKAYCVVGFKHIKFDYTKRYCCEGRAIPPKVIGRKLCCTITTRTNCCDTRNISVTSLKKASCCKTVLYDIDTEFCHNFTVKRRTDLQVSTDKIYAATKVPFHNTPINGTSKNSIYIVSICVATLVTEVLIVIVVCLSHRRSYTPSSVYIQPKSSSYFKMERDIKYCMKSHFETSFVSGNFSNDLETDGFENAEENDHHRLTQDATDSSNMTLDDLPNKDISAAAMETSNKRTQTDKEKYINISNVMGEEFDRKHVFDKNNMSLVLPNSTVKLTLAEEDVSDGPIECYASTYRNLKQIYSTFQSYMTEDEEIVSPTIEYYFPRNQRLNQFACIDMKYYSCKCDSILKVWRFECNPENGVVNEKVQIPNKTTLEDTKNVDAYYENVSPGNIRIYLKRFCTLMCSVCDGTHDCLSLTAHAYVVNVPCDGGSINVRVSLYILARVSELLDYAYGIQQFLAADEGHIVPKPKKICLPMNVRLEEDLNIRLKLWEELERKWQQRSLHDETGDSENVQLHNIVCCPRRRSDGQPYSKEWYFVCKHGLVEVPEKVAFNCHISINMVHPNPGVDTRQPPKNVLSLNHVVECSSTKTTKDTRPPERFSPSEVFQRSPIQESARTCNVAAGIGETDRNTIENRQNDMERSGILNSSSPAQFSPERAVQANAVMPDQSELQRFIQNGARPRQTQHHHDDGQSEITVADVNALNPVSRLGNAGQLVRGETAEDSI